MAQILPPTPLLRFAWRDARVLAKAESLQPMGAFKLRGAWHRLTALSPDESRAGVVAFSSGNHAQGVAWAAKRLGIPATIVMPADAPRLKLEGTRALGAEIVLYDRARESREAIGERLAAERGCVLVPSFDDPWVIEGQGSAGVEIAAQLGRRPRRIVIPCGGGGLSAGIALACPDAEIVVVEPEGWDDMGESLRRGAIVPVGANPPSTSCDALMTTRVSPLTFDVLRDRRATGIAVNEAEISRAIAYAARALRLVIEPGGAIALAALLAGRVPAEDDTVILLSGGNIDPQALLEHLDLGRATC
ncbi:threonine ammonia-lyase [Sphingomonas gilva]|nr:threonine/serine dehydratase [Sphingomonas gilva]